MGFFNCVLIEFSMEFDDRRERDWKLWEFLLSLSLGNSMGPRLCVSPEQRRRVSPLQLPYKNRGNYSSQFDAI